MPTHHSVDEACQQAASAFADRALHPFSTRSALLRRIADDLEAARDLIVETAHDETRLGAARLNNELGRTTGQLTMFADLVDDASWLDVRIETSPVDLRRGVVPLGPVAVFGASNFPLAFSVPGGDTASALAAGCPVAAKAHPGHPATSKLVGRIITEAVEQLGLPAGCFSLLHGGIETGEAIVDHPAITAVGFTGSLLGGRAIYDRAARRPTPIPVYAEMGSTNPVFVLPAALANRGDEIVEALAGSVTLGTGQFCTKPGLVYGLNRQEAESLASRMRAMSAGPMLTSGIGSAFVAGVRVRTGLDGVELLAGEGAPGSPTVLAATASVLAQHPALTEEVFGPATVVAIDTDPAELREIASGLDGQLTATVFADPEDAGLAAELAAVLQGKVGRLIWNDVPTGVAVNSAMHHGGPYPATTSSGATSVGTAAIWRFSRPVAWQNAPAEALPPELRDENPLGIWRLVDGERTAAPVLPDA